MKLIEELVRRVVSKVETKPVINISLPKKLNPSSIEEFLENIAFIFKLENKKAPNCVLDLDNLTKINLLGVLVIYKLIEYSTKKRCFYIPEIVFDDDGVYGNSLKKYGFRPLMDELIMNYDSDSEKTLLNIDVNITNRFIIAPQPLIRNDFNTYENIKTSLIPKLREYYTDNDKIISMISCCFSEILLNFWEHAIQDSETIIVAEGKTKFIEIACADSGNGIISTLRKNDEYKELNGLELMKLSVERNITSKVNTNHMGYGLWILNEICKKVKGRFHLYSEGYCYKLEYGEVTIKQTNYWKGTIVYLALNLDKPVSLVDIESLNEYNNISFQVNYLN